MNLPLKLGLVYFISEVVLRFSRRSGAGSEEADRGSLAVLWVAISAGIALGISFTHVFPRAAFPLSETGRAAAVGVFAAALVLRWWSILVLGKFFTVDVAIAADHQLVIRGPYRFARHPSYTGMMLAFAAFAVTLQNWFSIIAVLLPIAVALAFRIRIEEVALSKAFGEDYRRYSQSTRRLIPWIF